MITFKIESTEEKLHKASLLALQFFKELRLKDLPETFNYTNDNAAQVFLNISAYVSASNVVTVKEYTPWYRWSKAIGYAEGSTVFVNKYKVSSLEVEDYVNNFVHETMHLVGYSHKGNRVTQFNLGTVPYVIGSLAEAWVRGNK